LQVRFRRAQLLCLSPKAGPMKRSYWSGIRSAKNSTSSDAAGGSRLLKLTMT
jgi:hypothetical protein